VVPYDDCRLLLINVLWRNLVATSTAKVGVPLVHAAPELATAENEEPGAAHAVGRGPV
jgi:hypothetical protein